jgi:hypothetical protein
MTKHTEQEINEALKVVLEASANGDLEYRSHSLSTEKWTGWMESDLGEHNEYRAKPAEPRELWIRLEYDGRFPGYREIEEFTPEDSDGWIKVREVIE